MKKEYTTKKKNLGGKLVKTSLAATMVATSTSAMSMQILANEVNDETNTQALQNSEDTNKLFDEFLTEIKSDIPANQETASLIQNYQSNEPQEFNYYMGGGEAVVNNGLTFKSSGKTVAAFANGPYLSSGVVAFKYKTNNTFDTGFSIKSSSSNEGLAIRHESGGAWVIQNPSTGGAYTVTPKNPATEIKPDEEAIVQIGFKGNRLILAVNGTIAYDDDKIMSQYPGMADALGQVGIYTRSASATYSISNVSIQGVGTPERPVTEYRQDYENGEVQNWSANTNANIVDDGTGNKVLELSRKGGSERVVDLNSPSISNGTLSLNYKVVNFQSGLAFGFRYSDDASRFNELGVDGANSWIPESSSGWGSNLGLPEPNPGVWNNLMINFQGKSIRVFLNKELVAETTFDKYEEVAGKFGFRLRGGTKIQIDDLVYSSDILEPEQVNQYENDFEDKITGNWSDASTSIIEEGPNNILKISHDEGKTLSVNTDTESLGLAAGTLLTRVKSENSDMGFKVGDAQVVWQDGKWNVLHNGELIAFTGEGATEKLNERVWNKVGIQFSANKITLSVHGKTAEATLNKVLQAGAVGISSTSDVFVDDLLYSEKVLSLDTDDTSDKVYYEEYYESITNANYDGLTNITINDGKLFGNVAANTTAINNDIKEIANGVYQMKVSSSNGSVGLQMGSAKVYSNGDGKWYLANGEAAPVLIGEGAAFEANENMILRVQVLEGNIKLMVDGATIGSVDAENVTGGPFGFYNAGTSAANIAIDALGAEEIRVYTPDYADTKDWKNINASEVGNGEKKEIQVTLPGVSNAFDTASPAMLDQHVSFDFKTSVTAGLEGGRYGITLRTTDEKNYVGIEHDVNGNWAVGYKGSAYKFGGATLALEKDTAYGFNIDLVGTTVSLKITDKATGEVHDLGSVNVADLPQTAGHFGVRGWYSGKTLTISNLKMVEDPTLPVINNEVESGDLVKGNLTVTLDKNFPRIISYNVNGKTMIGQEAPVTTVNINGTSYTPEVSSKLDGEAKRDYVMRFKEIDVELHASIEAQENNVVAFNITDVIENGDFKVRSISMGNNTLAHVNSSMSDASYAYSSSSGEWHGVTEEIQDNLKDMDKGGVVGTTMTMLSGNGLAASVENNVMNGGNKVVMTKEKKSLVNKASIANGTWTYRHAQSEETEELPWAKVVLTEDTNEDEKVDWQDGAVAYRRYIFKEPFEAKDIANNMMYIAFNFASQANDPFLNTLETGKVLYNYTDGFGQMILHKGYQAEGHDDDIPSYSNIGVRQGGVDDFNKLINEGDKYNLNIGVHINATEYHLDANELDYSNLTGSDTGQLAGGWDWIDTSYYVDQTKDVLSGELAKRFTSLYNLTKDQDSEDDPTLDFYYIDVYTGNGYNGYKLLEMVNDLGVKVGTEFSGPMEPGVNFVHWGPDLGYPNKGNKSVLSRMVKNSQDIFVGNALFKGQKIPGVTTWGDSKPDMQQGVTVFNNEVLPTKFMQHHGVLKSEEDKITFEGEVTSTRNKETNMIELAKEGKLISTWADTGTTTSEDERHAGEATSLIPWVWDIKTNNVLTPDDGAKLYHWNPKGGSTTWELTSDFENVGEFTLYELTQQGKVAVTNIPVVNGKVTIDAKKNTPYVLYKAGVAGVEAAGNWGEGSAVHDFAFNAETLNGESGWQATGDAKIEIVPGKTEYTINKEMDESLWNRYAQINGNGTLSQDLDFSQLKPGQDYTVSVWTQADNVDSILEVKIGDQTYTNKVTGMDGIHRSSFKYVGTNWQRVSVEFHVPEDVNTGSIKLISIGEGTAMFDDVKVWQHTTVEDDVRNVDYTVKEDFENVYEGWGPFEYGGGSRQISITTDQSNPLDDNPVVDRDSGEVGPVMTWVLSGQNSLKINETDRGRSIKTNESSLKLTPNKKYILNFDYTSEVHSQYEVKVVSRSNPNDVVYQQVLENKPNNGKPGKVAGEDYLQVAAEFTTGEADDYQVVFTQIRADRFGADGDKAYKTFEYAFILDNFAVQEAADHAGLQALVDEYSKVINDDFTTTSWTSFQDALTAAREVLANEKASSTEITNAMTTLRKAYRGLAEIVGIKDLRATLEKAATYESDSYSIASWNTFAEAMGKASDLLNANSEDVEAISAANTELRNCMDELVNIVDLKAAISKAEQVKNDNYTTASWTNLKAAIKKAKDLLLSATTQASVDYAIEHLDSAEKALTPIGDFAKLEEIIALAKGKVESDYTSETWERFETALKAAEEFASMKDASQEEIDAEVTNLQSAIASLVLRIQQLVDNISGVVVEFANGVLPAGSEMRVNVMKEASQIFKTAEKALQAISNKFKVYEISFVEGSMYSNMAIPAGVNLMQAITKEVAINGRVTLSLPVPEGYNATTIKVYQMGEDGSLTDMNAVVNNGTATFTTTSAGLFVIADTSSKVDVDVKDEEDEVKDTAARSVATTSAGLLAGGAAILAALKLRKKKEDEDDKA